MLWAQFPSVKIVRQAKGKYSPDVDERCFTYCSQTVRGRAEQSEPRCRTFCLRRVFAHEVQRAIAVHDGKPPPAHAKIPLPPEGQNIPSLTHILIGESPEGQEGRAQQDEVRYWEEGYYVWLSKNKWAAHEKLDLMTFDLERQAVWAKYKQDKTEAWQKKQVRNGNAQAEQVAKGDAQAVGGRSSARRPFPDLAGQSILLPMPPPFPPLWEQIDQLLAPSHKLFALTQSTLQSGDQLKLAHRMWEKALTDQPFVLARNVCTRMWDKWKKGPPDDTA
ncbi:uncharacterized protein C8Q71DRAFT_711834 [Rhodofomes roseus]|uniref:Uncharacterized protein n=1 Tax=Rhodofomes roseus TaxID=34475 RepID=A0A4Y9Y0X4_9APHY|nr:uncharacterized protein C8Q71DRAFT_711834 [Rhodofomes roseus]KAH9834223.1 hypothetical protein C8Q71DRAFT_711834 [Rhodofomes roseus]TFY55692.1 hypothetical protein EVJ58_g8089 [Rhodofomes roseus]